MNNEIMYTTKETAEYLGVSSSTIHRIEKRGLINAVKISGGKKCFTKRVLETYLHKNHNSQVKDQSSSYTIEREKLNQTIQKKETNPYSKIDSISIYNDDILKMKSIEENTIDLIVTSPPYNLDIKYNSHDDKMDYETYLDFTKDWLAKCYKFAKDDGRFCLNIPLDKNKGGQKSVCADITMIAKKIGWQYHSTIIWNEGNISRRTAWGSWMSASAPYVIAPVEVILILYKKFWKKQQRGISDITKQEFMDWTNGVWVFNGESKKRIGHPAPFPVELPRRCIKLFSYKSDTILDPFLGSGSTMLACLDTKRSGIGVDVDKNYCALAKSRILNQIAQGKLSFKEGI